MRGDWRCSCCDSCRSDVPSIPNFGGTAIAPLRKYYACYLRLQFDAAETVLEIMNIRLDGMATVALPVWCQIARIMLALPLWHCFERPKLCIQQWPVRFGLVETPSRHSYLAKELYGAFWPFRSGVVGLLSRHSYIAKALYGALSTVNSTISLQ